MNSPEEKKNKYWLQVSGCDDSTEFEVELTDAEYQLVKGICEKCTATSTYGCMPTMYIQKSTTNDQKKETI